MDDALLHSPIEQLPPSEVEKISAGEVVERPLNVVKELIENSLDSAASEITIELEDGGKQLIRVSDNGSGIPAAELPLALKAHHTSKIRSLNDIYNLSTMGFRGEALSSIAAVSKLSITSRSSQDKLGASLEVSGGVLMECAASNAQVGTEVEVRELFFNTPVRIKFLRSRQSETSMVAKLVTSYCLAYPEVRWRLVSSGKELLSTPGGGDTRSVIAKLMGNELAGAMADVHFEHPPMAATGLISLPHHFRHNRTRQWYFVNRRPVVNKLLFKATDDAVREYVSSNKFPAGVFFIDVPPEELDVNVHPMKTEVNFSQPQAIYSLLTTAIRRALGQASTKQQRKLTSGLASIVKPAEDLAGDVDTSSYDDPVLDPAAPPGQRSIPVYQQGQPLILEGQKLRGQAEKLVEIEFPGAQPDTQARLASSPENETVSQIAGPTSSSWQEGEWSITQVAGSYLVAVSRDEVYLIDQHEAHERILFEKLYQNATEGLGKAAAKQKLLFPLRVKLSPSETELAKDILPALGQLGFSARYNPTDGLEITGVPMVLVGRVDESFLQGVLEDLGASGAAGASKVLAERVKLLASIMACRAAIKGNATLSRAEQVELVRQLLASESSLSCPHGSPTVIRLGLEELRRMFRR